VSLTPSRPLPITDYFPFVPLVAVDRPSAFSLFDDWLTRPNFLTNLLLVALIHLTEPLLLAARGCVTWCRAWDRGIRDTLKAVVPFFQALSGSPGSGFSTEHIPQRLIKGRKENQMPTIEIVKAWKDEEYRDTLTAEQLAQLPLHPAGVIEFGEPQLEDETLFGSPAGRCKVLTHHTNGCTNACTNPGHCK
jgi:mersacidin/lichenicidin family type 2 lantibiotic